jgi:transposase InsO family protein
VTEVRPCFLFHVDTIVIYWSGLKRYILTAVDHATRLGYARMYRNKRSRSAAEFLYRLRYLVNQPIENFQTDNGSKFALEFERATAKLGIHRYFSSVKTPKDNPKIERFNETLEYELLYNFNLSLGPQELNPRLNQWLIEYNFIRLHKSLAYLTPADYIEQEFAKNIPQSVTHGVTHVSQPPHPAKEGSVFRRKYQTGTHFARKKDN